MLIDDKYSHSKDSADGQGEHSSAVYLSDLFSEIDEGANFLNRLPKEEVAKNRKAGIPRKFREKDQVFFQGEEHKGIWLIEQGSVRTFYVGPTGREITLALWTSGHFVGGPEIFGGGEHVWSGEIQEDAELLFLSSGGLRKLIEEVPNFAVCIINGLVAKGKCYSALVQMLATRSVNERLAQLLIIFADTHGRQDGDTLLIDKKITHDQLANIVGSTRQWVTTTLDKFQKQGVISVSRQQIAIEDLDALNCML